MAKYLQISRKFSFRQLQSWLRSNLQVNPFGVSAILAQGFKQHELQIQSKKQLNIDLSVFVTKVMHNCFQHLFEKVHTPTVLNMSKEIHIRD